MRTPRRFPEPMAHPQVRGTRMCLATSDAHGLYEKFGFERQELMRRRPDAPINPGISQFVQLPVNTDAHP